jgi:hypothetical protein
VAQIRRLLNFASASLEEEAAFLPDAFYRSLANVARDSAQ